MKLITPRILHKMRRSAEQLHGKHRESLATYYTVIDKGIAKELGLPVRDAKLDPLAPPANQSAGIFDDEPEVDTAAPVEYSRVKFTDLVEALGKFKLPEPAKATDQKVIDKKPDGKK